MIRRIGASVVVAVAILAAGFYACGGDDDAPIASQPRMATLGTILKAENIVATGTITAGGVITSLGAQVFTSVDNGGGLVDSTTPGSVGLTRACGTNQVLQWGGTAWSCATISGGGGTVTTAAPITGTGSAGSAVSLLLTTTTCGTGSDVNAISSSGVGTCSARVASVAGLTGATGGLSCSTSSGAASCWAGSATGCSAGSALEDVTGGSAGWQCVAWPSGGAAPSGTGYVHVTSSVYDTPSNALSSVTSLTASGLVKVGGSQDTCSAFTTSGVINDWNPSGVGWGGVSCVYANITSDSDLTGLLAGVDGQRLRIYDVGAGHLTLNHQNTNSTTAADRLITPNAVQEVIAGDSSTGYQFVDFQYNTTLARWVMGAHSGTVFSGGTFTSAITQTASGFTTVGIVSSFGYSELGTKPALTGAACTGGLGSATGGAYSGTITTSSGTGSCIATFSTALSGTPSCTVTNRAGGSPAYSLTTGALTITAATSSVYDFTCVSH